MKADQSKDYYIKEKATYQGSLFTENRKMQHGAEYQFIPSFSISRLFHKLVVGLKKLLIALRYQFSRYTYNLPMEGRLPWFKIGLALLVVFILTKKDIQFSFNLKAPMASLADDPQNGAMRNAVDNFGVAQPISLKKEPRYQYKSAAIDQLESEKVKTYIKQYAKVAVTEMEKFGVPASIKMGQAILASWAGKHNATKKENNHFGLLLDGNSFDSASENWRAHSVLLQSEYGELFKNGTSYKKWAKGLKKEGYTKEKQYDQKLIEVIETYQLYLLDER